jgi:hypothetical protein
MRTFTNLAVIVLFIFLGSSCSSNNTKWDTYKSPNGGFSVFMPEHPKTFDKTESTPFGKQVIHYVQWKPATCELYKIKLVQIAFTDCPRSLFSDSLHVNAIMDSSINQRKRDFTELDILSHPVDINGYPGRAFMYDPAGDNVITTVKQCFANDRRYDITVVTKRDYPTNAELNNFFNSFTILK